MVWAAFPVRHCFNYTEIVSFIVRREWSMAKRIIIGRFPGADALARPSLEACRYIYICCPAKRNKASASSGLRIVVYLGSNECPTAIKVLSLPLSKPFRLCRAKGFCYLCFRDRQKHDAVAAICAFWCNCPCWGRRALQKSALRQAPKNKTRWNY